MEDFFVKLNGKLRKLSEVIPEGSRTIDSYEKLDKIGEGSFGEVYKAKDKETGEIIALKKLRMELNINELKELPRGLLIAILEVNIVRRLNHENVIKLKEAIFPRPWRDRADGGNINNKVPVYMVFEYMEHDLAGLLNQSEWSDSLTTPQIKCYMKQLLKGLHYCHVNKVLHRDIKAANLLINNEGILKIADFGRSTLITDKVHTNQVIPLRYRPPELLLGAINYGTAVDIWSAGCILGMLLNRTYIFNGKTEADTLNNIFELCGAPDETNWPGVSDLPLYTKMKPSRPMPRRLGEIFERFGQDALDLLERMLTLDPNQRISAQDALDADYFRNDPLPSDPKSLPKFELSSHYYETMKTSQPKRPSSQPCSPPLPRPRKRPSVGSHGGGGPHITQGSKDMPRFGCQGASGSGSKYGGEAPNCPQRYGLPDESRDGPSSSSRGGGDSGSAYEGEDPNDSPGSRDISSSGSHGGGRDGSGSADEGGSLIREK